MIYNTDYTNCKLLIRDEASGETIVETRILEFNKKQLSIFVDARDFIDEINQKRLLLLIFTSNSIHHFGGVARKSYSPRKVEISMFQGKQQEDRSAKRYPASIDAYITNIFYDEENEAADKNLYVKIINLSANGVLIEAADNELEVNDIFRLSLVIASSPTIIKCKVVRRADNEGFYQYGCRLLVIEND